MGKYDKAEPLYKRALSIRQTLFGARHEDIAQSMNSLGCLNQDMGRYEPHPPSPLLSSQPPAFSYQSRQPQLAPSGLGTCPVLLDDEPSVLFPSCFSRSCTKSYL